MESYQHGGNSYFVKPVTYEPQKKKAVLLLASAACCAMFVLALGWNQAQTRSDYLAQATAGRVPVTTSSVPRAPSTISKPSAQPTLGAQPIIRRPGVIARAEETNAETKEGEVETKAEAPKGIGYIDEMPEIKKSEMSPEQIAKLRKEYTSFGGSPNEAMGNNYFLIIILVIAGLAVVSWLTGALDVSPISGSEYPY